MDEDFDIYREVQQELARLVAEISPESYERLRPGLQELGLALAEQRVTLREVDHARELQERVLEDYNRVLEGYDRAKEGLERAEERTQNALRLIKDAL